MQTENSIHVTPAIRDVMVSGNLKTSRMVEQDSQEQTYHLHALVAAVIRQAVDDLKAPQPKGEKARLDWWDNKRTAREFLLGVDGAAYLSYLGINRQKALSKIGLETEDAEPTTNNVLGVPAV